MNGNCLPSDRSARRFEPVLARDLVMLTLLTGMTALCGIGAYLGPRRVLRASIVRR
jgi:hypothetical protein